MRFLIIADPTERLLPAGDGGLEMFRQALARGHEVHWATHGDVSLLNGRAQVRSRPGVSVPTDAPPTLGPVQTGPVSEFDSVWIRKDPPFDLGYIHLCWILSLEEAEVCIVNPASALLRLHEKLIPFLAFRAGFLREEELIPTWMPAPNDSEITPKWNVPEGVVYKPWLGHGGRNIETAASLRQAWEQIPPQDRSTKMIQPKITEIAVRGDRRVYYIDGEVRGSFVRIPPEGSVISNIASGGRGELREMTREEQSTCDRLGDYLRTEGIILAGADLLAGRISEVNVTAPTNFVLYRKMTGVDLVSQYLDVVEKNVKAMKNELARKTPLDSRENT